jgi:hypothetical protein
MYFGDRSFTSLDCLLWCQISLRAPDCIHIKVRYYTLESLLVVSKTHKKPASVQLFLQVQR